MARFIPVEISTVSNVKHIADNEPKVRWINEVCTVYEKNASLKAIEICNSLNMAHELRQLPPSATKKQLLEIINKYR